MKNTNELLKSEKGIFIIILLLTIITVFLFNLFTPLVADDYSYSGFQSVAEILKSNYNQYFNSNGRVIAHLFAKFFLMFDKMFFNIINTLVFVWMIICIYLHTNIFAEKKYNNKSLLLIVLCIWLFTDKFGQAVLWLTGACNYMWGITMIISFLLPYYYYLVRRKNFKTTVLPAISMFLFGIMAGWSSENVSGGSLIICLMIIGLCKLWDRRIHIWMILGALGNAIGLTFLVLSPGAAKRAKYFVDNRSSLVKYYDRFKNCTLFGIWHLWLLVLIFIAAILVQRYYKQKKRKMWIQFLFAFAAAASLYALILSPAEQKGRVTFGVVIFAVIAAVTAFNNIPLEGKWIKSATKILLILLAAAFIFFYGSGFKELLVVNGHYKERDQYVVGQIQKGETKITVPFISPYPKSEYSALHGLEDITDDMKYWLNKNYAEYMGAKTVTAVSYEEWHKKYKEKTQNR